MTTSDRHDERAARGQHGAHGNHHEISGAGHASGVSKEERQAIAEGLAAIYGDERSDLTKLDRAGSRVTWFLTRLVAILAVLAVVAFGGFFLYSRYFAQPAAAPLSLAIDAPAEVMSGSAQRITVHYGNAGRVPLAALAIDLNVPQAFHVTSMSPMPTDLDELIWNVGTLTENTDQEIVLDGVWLAEVPSTTTVQALATFRPANFNADFDQAVSSVITTTTSGLRLTLSGPEEVASGASATYTAVLENTSDMTLPGVQFTVRLPEGFVLASSAPALTAGAPAEWLVGDMLPAATSIVSFTGAFSADAFDVQQFVGTVSLADGLERLSQVETTAFTDVIGNDLRVQLVANGSTGDVALDPGEPLRITIAYTNTGDTDLSDVTLLVDFQSEQHMPVDWRAATLDGGKLTADGIAFSAATIGALTPQDKKIRNLIFPLDEEVAADDAQSWQVVLHATVGGVTVQTQPLTIRLNADAEFTARARYYSDDGAPLGDGPLPPKVGEETAYQLLWTLGNSTHALEDVRMSATLPPGVTWMGGDAQAGLLNYDTATRTVTWDIAHQVADAGAVTATMDVAITPSEDDVGKFVKLLSGSAFRATDTVTSATLQQTADALTTECEGDALVAEKGTVEE